MKCVELTVTEHPTLKFTPVAEYPYRLFFQAGRYTVIIYSQFGCGVVITVFLGRYLYPEFRMQDSAKRTITVV